MNDPGFAFMFVLSPIFFLLVRLGSSSHLSFPMYLRLQIPVLREEIESGASFKEVFFLPDVECAASICLRWFNTKNILIVYIV